MDEKYFIRRNWNKIFNIRKKYYIEPFIYVDDSGRAVIPMGSSFIKFLEKFHVEHWSESDANDAAFKILHEKYPELKGKILIY